MSPSRFLWTTLALMALLMAAVAGINVWVDPYLVHDRARRAGFNAVKPAVETREALMKAQQSARVAPSTIVLGSSRSDIGFDPASSAWPEALRPVYNLSTVGADLRTNLQFLERMLAHGRAKPQRLVVGLDFESFLYPTGHPPAATAPAEPAADALEPLRDWVAATLTLDALLDSANTLRANRGGVWMDLEPTGRLAEGHLRRWTADDGVALLFEQKNRLTVQRYGKPRHVLGDSQRPLYDLPQLDALARLARERSLELVLIVQPAHVSRLELLDTLGYWPLYEQWKRELAAFGERSRAAGMRVVVWDFGGYETFTTEDVPAVGDRQSRLRWFWDPVHYTTALGDAMVGTFAGANPAYPPSARLSPETVDARLAEVRAARDAWRASHGDYAAALRRMACAGGGCDAPRP